METSGLHEPKQSRSQQTLDRILQSSTALIAEQSYDDVTITDIAARSQISVGGFYSRFRNKEALLSVLAENLAHETQTRISSAMSSDWAAKSLAELLNFIVTNNVELYEKYRGVLAVIHLRTRVLLNRTDDNKRRDYNQKLVSQLESLLLMKRDQILHRHPRVAIRTSIACMTSMLRDAIVFNDRSLYPAPRNTKVVSRQVANVMYQYLTAGKS